MYLITYENLTKKLVIWVSLHSHLTKCSEFRMTYYLVIKGNLTSCNLVKSCVLLDDVCQFRMSFIDVRLIKMNDFLLSLTILLAAVVIASCEPYQPGQPGGEWSEEEIDIVREKVNQIFSSIVL